MYNNIFLLTKNLTLSFLLINILILNSLYFLKTECVIKKIFATVCNLICCSIAIVLESNEAFAYLLLLTEISAIVVLSPIMMSSLDISLKKEKISDFYYLITFIIIFFLNLFFFDTQKLQKYTVFKNTPKENSNIYNDLYSLFLELGSSYIYLVFFTTMFLVVNIIIVFVIKDTKSIKFKNISFRFLKNKLNSAYNDFVKKYNNNIKTIFFKFKKWKNKQKNKQKK